ncbi:MAG: GH25 family lysozyme [bacterium]|nr:GH25 family lysozyme [bacterium]
MKKRKVRILASLLLMMLFVGTVFNYGSTTAAATSNIAVKVTHPAMNTIKLSWEKVSGAAGYNIYHSKTQNGTYELVSSIVDTSVIFDNLDTDTYYYFKVVSYSLKNGSRVEGVSSGIIKERSNSIGIDVSKWQSDINWAKVKQDGIDFAIVRVAYGASSAAEDKYQQNLKGANANGIPVGVYIYSKATTVDMAKKEAQYVLSIIKGYNITYPVCYDIEDDDIQGKLSNKTNTSMVKAFFDVIEKAGYTGMLYTGDKFSEAHLNMNELTMYDWWIPHYATSSYYYPYKGNYHFKDGTEKVLCQYYKHYHRMWQYSERGKVNGINGYVDMNYELDLKEETTGMVYVDLKKDQQSYVAGDRDTIKTIATKFGITAEELVKQNPTYNVSSQVMKGQSVIINTLALTAPTVTIEMGSSTSIKLSFGAVSLAEGYEIYHSTSEKGTYKKIATTKELHYTHTKVSSSVTNYYKVVAYRTLNGVYETATSPIVSHKLTVNKVTGLKAVSTNYNSVKVTWSKVNGATGYKVYSSTAKNGTYKLIKTTTATNYTNTKLAYNKTVYYKVTAYVKGTDKDIESALSGYASAKPIQESATDVKAATVTNNSIKLTWTKASGATSYHVYRATSKNGSYTKIATVTANTYTNTKLTKNKTYYYKVRAIKTVSKVDYAAADTAVLAVTALTPVKLTAPKITEITGYNDRVYVRWSAVKDAQGYEVYRSDSKTGTYKKVISKAANYINNTGLQKNKTYYYKVRAYYVLNGKTTYSSYSSILSAKTVTASSTTPSVPASNIPTITEITGYNDRVYMEWSTVKGVTGYEVFRSTSKTGTYTRVVSKTAAYINNTGLEKNKTYYYKVRTYTKVNNKTTYSAFSSILSVKTTTATVTTTATTTAPQAPKITKITGASGSVSMTWSTVKDVTGYEVFRSTSQNGTYKRVVTKSATSLKNTGLDKNKSYYYKVRSYKTVNGKTTYSTYSPIKSIKTTK